MNIFKSRITGNRHLKINAPCQDYCGVTHSMDKDSVILALADGAGSAKFAEIGAMVNVESFLNFFRKYDTSELQNIRDSYLAEDIINCCYDQLNRYCHLLGEPDFKHFNATLIGVCIAPERISVFHIGDGAVFVESSDGAVSCVSKPDNLFFMSNMTRFLEDKDASKHFRFSSFDRSNVKAVALVTDGVSDCYTKNGIEFVSDIFSQVHNGSICDDISLGMSIDTELSKDNGDDHSMIIAEL